AEIVGVEFQLIAAEQARLFVDVHGERRDRAVDVELPVPIARRLGAEIDDDIACLRELSRRLSHHSSRILLWNYNSKRNYSAYPVFRQQPGIERSGSVFNALAMNPENPVGERREGGERFLGPLAMRRMADAGHQQRLDR